MSRFRNRRGVGALEFALLAPLLLLLFAAGTDLVSWYLTWLRLDRAADELCNVITQASALHAADFADPSTNTGYFAVAQQLAGSMPVTGQGGATIVSGLVNDGTTTRIAWQQRTGSGAYVSVLGAAGQSPVLPTGYTVPSGQTAIATETFTGITLWVLSINIMNSGGPTSLSAFAIYRPRSAELSSVQP